VVVDDGSTDGGGDIARGVGDGRIRVIRQPNGGLAAARNRGIAESRTPYVAYVDADDEWEPGFVEAVVCLTERFPQAGMYVTGMRHVFLDGNCMDMSFALPGDGDIGVTDQYFAAPEEGYGMATGSSTMLRKEVLDEVGLFPVGEPMGQDVDLWVRVAARYPVAFDRRILAIYYRDDGQRETRRATLKPPYPPALRTLRRIIQEWDVPSDRREQIKRYTDCRAMDNVYWQAGLQLPSARQTILNERYYTLRYRFEGMLLRLGVWVFPPKLLYALRWIPVAAVKKLRRLLFGSPGVKTGRVFVFRRWRTAAPDKQAERT
jgi:glycosyltransferase involved in cell wall biosynthesis